MRTRIRSLVLAAAVACAALLTATPAVAAFAPGEPIPYDHSPALKGVPAPRQLTRTEAKAVLALCGEPYLYDGREPDLVLTLYDWDPAHAGPHVVPFWKEYSGHYSDVYVAWNDLEPPPSSRQRDHTITPAQVARMGVEFDERIWKSNVFHFGRYKPRVPKSLTPEEQAAYDGNRAAIMVYNIRDEAYWSDYPFYIAGYFWGGLNDELGINAIFIDSYDWANRTGPDSARPYLYEGTIAHEFQHLIHNDVDGDEDSFVDEGLADLAEQFIYGTTTTSSHIGYYLTYHRDSLLDWQGELYDHGNAVLWTDYLWEQAGGGTLQGAPETRVAPGHDVLEDSADKFADPGDRYIWELIHDQDNGLASYANRYAAGMDEVERLHRDFTLANLLDGKTAEPRWNYRNLELGGPDSDGATIADGIHAYATDQAGARIGGTMPLRRVAWRRAYTGAWGAYYRVFVGQQPGTTLTFTGRPTDGVASYSPPYEWFGGAGNMRDHTLTRRIENVGPDAVLTFMTWFDIEKDWDYGYVEASSDGTTWVKLPQLSTLPAGSANVNGSSAYDGPGGLTGSSGGWKQARFSLHGFEGDVWIRFRYVTDEAVNGQGFYIDDISVGEWLDTVEVPDGWVSDGWEFTTGLQDNDWTCDVYAPFAKATERRFDIVPLVSTADTTFSASAYFPAQWAKNEPLIAIVANRPRNGTFESFGRLTAVKGR